MFKSFKNYLTSVLISMLFLSVQSQEIISRNAKTALHRGVYEITFNNSVRFGDSGRSQDPYYETILNVTFTTPGGEHVKVDGFYEGGTLFKARAYCYQEGLWKWSSTSNDPAMDGRSGEFNVLPSSLQGKLRIHPDDHYQFARDNGDWFLHIGDTGYRFVVASEPYWKEYIDQASEMGATKIRTWFAMERSNVGNLFTDSGTLLALNFWKEIERRIIYTLENHPHIVLQLIPYAEDANLVNRYAEGDPVALVVARYAQARWSSFPNVQWTISNDLKILKQDTTKLTGRQVHIETINMIGRDMAAREPWGTLISNQQSRFDGYDYYQEDWSDITTIEDLDQVHGARILEYREKAGKPVVHDEDRYELYRGPAHRRYFFRRLMWASLLSGGHTTYGGARTYEAHGNQTVGASGALGRLTMDYTAYEGYHKGMLGYYDANREGILFQGAHDFKHIHNFFRTTGITLVGMKPDDALAGNDPYRFKCMHNNGTYILYLANPSGNVPETDFPANRNIPEVSIELASGKYEVRWYDPVTGTWVHGGMINGGRQILKAPWIEDWVLLIEKF